jgi:hypothetical protein
VIAHNALKETNMNPYVYTQAVGTALLAACIMLLLFGVAFLIVVTIDEVQAHRRYRRRRCVARRITHGRTWA